MDDKLVEKVARAIDPEAFGERDEIYRSKDYLSDRDEARYRAREIIPLVRAAVIEECARVAEEQQDEQTTTADAYYNVGCRVAAKAIRALAKENDDGR